MMSPHAWSRYALADRESSLASLFELDDLVQHVPDDLGVTHARAVADRGSERRGPEGAAENADESVQSFSIGGEERQRVRGTRRAECAVERRRDEWLIELDEQPEHV